MAQCEGSALKTGNTNLRIQPMTLVYITVNCLDFRGIQVTESEGHIGGQKQ